MSIDRVKHGETFTLSGRLAAGDTLIGLTGSPGALIEVSGTARNLGTIELYGASLPHKQGATLNVTGVLANKGCVLVGGASNATHAALLQIAGTLSNTATLTAEAGTDGAGGRIVLQGSARLNNSGTITLAAGATAGSSGATLTDTGVLINGVAGVIDVGGADGAGSGGVLDVSGTLTNNGVLNLYTGQQVFDTIGGGTLAVAGLLQNAGVVTVGKAQLSHGYAVYGTAGALLSVSGTLANTGSIFVTASPPQYFSARAPGPSSTLAISGTLINQGQITLQYGAIGGHYAYPGYGAQLQNTGTIENSGLLLAEGSSSYAAGRFPETGATIADSGVLTNTGTVLLQQNTELGILGTLTNDAMLHADGGSSFFYLATYRGNGADIKLEGVMSNSGTVSLDGGVTAPAGYYATTQYNGLGSQFSISGTGILTNTGLVDIGGGGGGYPGGGFFGTITATGATLSIGGGTDAGIINYGTVEIMAGQISSYGIAGGGGLLLDSGFISNRFGGVITIAGGAGTADGVLRVAAGGYLSSSDGTINGAGELLNLGTMEIAGGNTDIAVATFINDGTVDTADSFASVDTIDSAIIADPGQPGTLTLFNETLRLNGAISASQTIVFAANPGFTNHSTLALAQLGSFGAALGGIAAGDIIDFVDRDVISATATGDTLAIGLSVGTTIDLALTAPLAGLSLSLTSDSHGGTNLLFSAAPHGFGG